MLVLTLLWGVFLSSGQAKPAAAIFLDNRHGPAFNDYLPRLQDSLAAELTSQGLVIIDANLSVRVLKDYEGLVIPETAEDRISGEALDALLMKRTSAQQLARDLGADYLLHASVTSYDMEIMEVTSYGKTREVVNTVLRLSYRVAGLNRGGAILGDTLEIKERTVSNPYISRSETTGATVNKLLLRASRELAAAVAEQAEGRFGEDGLPEPEEPADTVPLTVSVGIRDVAIPEIVVDDSGNYMVKQKKFPIQATGVAVELNGSVVGSAPGVFQVTPGFHVLSLSRDDLKPFSRRINVSRQGSELHLDMVLDDAAKAEWRENLQFLEGIKRGTKLTDGQQEVLRGYAKMLGQSGYRVDVRRGADGTGDVYLGGHRPGVPGVVPVVPDGLTGLGFSPAAEPAQEQKIEDVIRSVEKSVGVVVTYIPMRDGSIKPFPTGTVSKIKPNLFATNSHVVEAVAERNKKFGAKAYILMNKSPRMRVEVRSMSMHPKYKTSMPSVSGKEAVSFHSDVGFFITAKDVPHPALPLASKEELEVLDAGSKVFYVGFPTENLLLDNIDLQSPLATVQIGNITTVSDFWLGDSGFEQNYLVRHNLGATGGASGSPIFNTSGKVVAFLNGGNVMGTLSGFTDEGKPEFERIPSGVSINFGIRSDMLKEVPGY